MSEPLGIFSPSGTYGNDWPANPVLSQGLHGSLSDAGWTEGNEGIPQQTFLGASIRSFNLNAGFGDTVSTLSVELVNDEFNLSDLTELGSGDDPYHNGQEDEFRPPAVGTPVYFKFGTNPATIEQAYRKTFDETYPEYSGTLNVPPNPFPEVQTNGQIEKIPAPYHYLRKIENKNTANQENTWVDKSLLYKYDTVWRGKDHLAFGGILQSYTQNRSPQGGDPLYSVQVTDPREILSNATVILNNYAGTTFNNKNLLNVFGFLEHDPSEPLQLVLEANAYSKNIVQKLVDPMTGNFTFIGDDSYHFFDPANAFVPTYNKTYFNSPDNSVLRDALGKRFPITGQGFARRSERGMPWYRVRDGLAALMNYDGFLPREYEDAGYGGPIDFRGYKYVVDFGGIPLDLIPPTYFLDFDQIDLLSLAQELCDVISHDLFVSLLPVINHPACSTLYEFNQDIIQNYSTPPTAQNPALQDFRSQMIAGIIRIDAIDKRKPPTYGAIKSYLDFIRTNDDVEVENQDLGYELSNVTTDKFVTGGQEVNMYYFTTNKDRNDVELRKHKDGKPSKIELLEREKWGFPTMLKQQVLPFYGFIGQDKAVTIPKGFGSYQQICLDSTGLNAYGVGNYYIATEIELRAAMVSYEQWKRFLLQYDEQWMKRLRGPQKTFDAHVPADVQANIVDLGLDSDFTEYLKLAFDGEYGVSVPRSVWRSDKNYLDSDGLPASPCAPPYGFPLYYKRAEKIGIPEGGIISVINAKSTIISDIERLKNKADKDAPYFNMITEDAEEAIKKIERNIHLKKVQIRNSTGNDATALAKYKDQLSGLTIALQEAKNFIKKVEEDVKKIQESDKAKMAFLKDHVTDSQRLIKNVSRLAKEGEANARKVYNFVKQVADQNLGKKFLVKIPKKTNLNFTNKVTFWEQGSVPGMVAGGQASVAAAQSIRTGPFGFRPLPVTATNSYYYTGTNWPTTFALLRTNVDFYDAFEEYLDWDKQYAHPVFRWGYNNGALKCNYNPFADKWEFNYKPEPQGGYVDHELRGFQVHPDQGYTQGGWGRNVYAAQALPKDLREGLTPLDSKNLMKSTNRMSCYVRFDNSHFYDFARIPKDKLAQQSINNMGFILPDVMEDLDNINPDESQTMEEVQNTLADNKLLDRQNPSMAFVACDVDEELYMPPPMTIVPTPVFSRGFKCVVPIPRIEMIQVDGTDDPSTDFDETKCKIPSGVMRKQIPVFTPAQKFIPNPDFIPEDDPDNPRPRDYDPDTPKEVPENLTVNTYDFDRVGVLDGKPVYIQDKDGYIPESGKYGGWGRFQGDIMAIDAQGALLVNSVKNVQSANHVYALVTLPGMVTSQKDIRYCDGPLSAYQTVDMYSLQTRDVVKGLREFDSPAVITNGSVDEKCENLQQFTLGEINKARNAHKQAMKNAAQAALDNTLNFISPSPVYPDLFAIPLMSMERSYGPWLSNASLDPFSLSPGVSNIGGRIEFEKDENLAPWNFGGYQLMNEAGYLKAQFSNSLLLFSERGGFVIPKAPTGISLAKTLKLGGPLVTSIDVGVSDNKISTTIKMDLYTSSFGKLQKQKEGNIAQITREKQKLKDQRNNAIRRGMGKTLSNKDLYKTVLEGGGQDLLDAAKLSEQHFSDFEKGKMNTTNYLMASKPRWENGDPVTLDGQAQYGAGKVFRAGVDALYNIDMEQIKEIQALAEDGLESIQNAAQQPFKQIGSFYKLISKNFNNPNAPKTPQENKDVEKRRGTGGQE